ncbi:uncharacterized protein LOC101691438 isoform X3 [Mustela putorius furo]|uniref:Uncharacterized protein LOC101691438 isoform X3 n=1 Tax=Mustela putorius furo TaxID=9669 RepID=A0A8U0NWH9_MUSPF|nr:uncharacterized protein LOC101691438 isoform X3 [Mustela putorius furo]
MVCPQTPALELAPGPTPSSRGGGRAVTSQPGFSAPNKDPDCDWIMRMKAVMGKKGGNKSQRQRKKAFGVCGTCSPGSGGSGVYSWECSPSRSGSTCLNLHKPCEDWPRSILKTSTTILMQKSLSADKKKAQRWDEMNILATYHPADKDYGFMKVDEPSTPYHRLQDSDEDMPGAVSHTVTPQALAERFATMDNFYPKVLRYRNKRSSESSDIFSKTHSSDFDKHRKSHYDEGKFLKAQKSLPFSKNKPCHGARSSLGSGSQVMEPRPVERGRMGGLTGEVQDEICLVTRNHIPEVKGGALMDTCGSLDAPGSWKTQRDWDDSSDPPTFRNPSLPSATVVWDQDVDQQRKEYYSKGRYLRCSPHPELEEDTEDEPEQRDSSADFNWVIESPTGTEIRLLEHTESPVQDPQASEESLAGTSQPGSALSSKDRAESGWCQWVISKGLDWRNPESLEKELGSSPHSTHQNQCRYETLQIRWTQEEESRQ